MYSNETPPPGTQETTAAEPEESGPGVRRRRKATATTTATDEATASSDRGRQLKLSLTRAAELAGERGDSLDKFMNAAYRAFLKSNPAAREKLAEAKLAAEIAAMRRAGRVGKA
jgi:hypothetical protein